MRRLGRGLVSELSDVSEPPTSTSTASRMSGYKTRSDSLMLMRQIKSLKDLGSNLGGDLETSSRTFLSGVQIVRTGNKPQVVINFDELKSRFQVLSLKTSKIKVTLTALIPTFNSNSCQLHNCYLIYTVTQFHHDNPCHGLSSGVTLFVCR